MSEIITADNFPSFNIKQETELIQSATTGATTITLKSDTGFSTNNAILVGYIGSEKSEILIPTQVTDNVVTVPALAFSYDKRTPVYVLRGHKIRLYRAMSETRPTSLDSFTLQQTVSIIADQMQTEITDSDGGSAYWYLYTFYNDLGTPTETSKDLLTAVRGGGFGLYVSADEVKAEAGLSSNRYIKDQDVYQKLISAQSEVDSSLALSNYTLPLTFIPEMVRHATLLLAAGYLLTREYDGIGTGTEQEGLNKIEQARAILKKIELGELPLLDENGDELTKTANPQLVGEETEALFTRDMVY